MALLFELYFLITLLAPMVLSGNSAISRHPTVILAAWHGSLLAATLSLTLALGLLISAGVTVHYAPQSSLANQGPFYPLASTVLAWGATAVLGALIFRVVSEGREVVREQAARSRTLGQLLAVSSPGLIGGWPVRLIDSPVPLAAALPASGAILVSTGTQTLLDPPHLLAVVEHEAAHIRHHHAAAVAVARISQTALPAISATRRLTQATSIVVELIADDSAARHCGVHTVAHALLSFAPEDDGVASRAHRLTTQSIPNWFVESSGAALCSLLPLLPLAIAFLW